ncbi:PLP-dependent aminotransferase family protein [Brevibacillus choshinensis]|uniref:PLP-dependent aminotransferase family protein n=1 Tax=Brevibacillus choshinensis TaxID=54911 RepID=A0ABX7FNM9_BRECH|nr:PLP-dependent aminotransferase family protein [Brevibacillus choshinensis]QRG66907.1 PLP-dependent aminotransferase family protein [Brevibacillus choshinensis]
MEWQPDKQGDTPVYQQIAQWLEGQIVQGDLPPGTSLPAERVLAKRFGVNRGTVSAAYEELRAAGLLQSMQGSGTWVSRHLWGVQRVPNWHKYTNGGAFLPAYPLVKRIQEACFDTSIINLAKAELATPLIPSLDPQELLRLQQTPQFELGYTHPKGDMGLREVLSRHLRKQYGIPASPEEILVTSGAQQALHLISLCLLSPGDAVAMEGPSYSYSLPLFTSAGLRLYRLSMDAEGIIPEGIRQLHQEHKLRMVFANPTYHNPTGLVTSERRRKQILDTCMELRIPLVEDDAYGALSMKESKRPPQPIKAFDKSGTVLYVNSVSKTIAPGLRIGWLVGPRSVVERLADAKQQMDFGTSTVSQQLARSFLEHGRWEAQIERLSSYLYEQRNATLDALQSHLADLVEWNVPEGSYHVWGRLYEPREERVLLDAAIREGVVFTPGSVYGAEAGWLRLTYSWEQPASIHEGMRRLQKAILAGT